MTCSPYRMRPTGMLTQPLISCGGVTASALQTYFGVTWLMLVTPDQAHGTDQLVLQDLQHAHHAVLAAGGQAPALQPAQGHDVGAQGDRFQDVAAALHPTVHDDARSARSPPARFPAACPGCPARGRSGGRHGWTPR